MKKIDYLKKVFENLKGNVLLIGVKEQTLLDQIEGKKEINTCYMLNSEGKSSLKKQRWSLKKDTTISIKKFRKKFKKKRMDTIICNIEEMESYFKTFIKDSIYICKGTIYFYGSKRKMDSLHLKEKYRRYKVKIEEENVLDGKILIIHVGKAKTYRIKELWYSCFDFVISCANIISDYLVN